MKASARHIMGISPDQQDEILREWNPLDGVPPPPPPVPERWHAEHVGLRLIDAYRAIESLPPVRGPAGFKQNWGFVSPSEADMWARALAHLQVGEKQPAPKRSKWRASASELSHAYAAVRWPMLYLAGEPRWIGLTIRWAHAKATRRDLDELARREGMTPRTYRWRRGHCLAAIAHGLNKDKVMPW